MGGPSEDDVVAAHLDWCHFRGLSDSTIEQRRLHLARTERAIEPTDLIDATHDQLYEHLSRSMTVGSRASEISHLTQFYQWALHETLIPVSPMRRIRRPKVPRRLPRPISEADLEMAVRFAPDRIRPMLILAGWVGLRAAEIAGLRAEDIQWEHRVLIVGDAAKGGKHASVPLCQYVLDELRYLPTRGWLFPRRDDQPGPVRPHLVSHLANNYLHSMGIPDTLHSLRHRFGTRTYKASDQDLRVTQELMRHATPTPTAIYTWVDPRDTRAVVDRLPVPV